MLDNLANNLDYGLGRNDSEHRNLQLYSGANGWVRAGTGRDNDPPYPADAVRNTSFLDSWEHLFNHDEDARPGTVRDVVWVVNTAKATVEVAFDDYLDADALIVTEGNAATQKAHPFPSTNQPTYQDGFAQSAPRGATYLGQPKFANAATPLASRWPVPAYGDSVGALRLEPVAMGGIVGKGIWIPGGGDAVLYSFPALAGGITSPTTRTISLFVDPRFGEDDDADGSPDVRGLLALPDGTSVDLLGLSQLRYRRPGQPSVTVSLAGFPLARDGWNHLAWVIQDNGATIHFFRDGYLWQTTHLAGGNRMFNVLPTQGGSLYVGTAYNLPAPAFKGWVDEIKVYARALDPETVCNLGHGTLRRIDGVSSLDAQAARYTTHAALSAYLGVAAGPSYACHHDYANPELALLRHPPANTTSVRGDIVFPEGPLDASQPRPDSSANRFCQGCHTSDNASPTLQPGVLYPDATVTDGIVGNELLAPDDPRRQPMQTPPVVFGHVPVDYFHLADPHSLTSGALVAGPDGEPIDPYVLVP
jgi:hypothetical protein